MLFSILHSSFPVFSEFEGVFLLLGVGIVSIHIVVGVVSIYSAVQKGMCHNQLYIIIEEFVYAAQVCPFFIRAK